MSSTLDMHSSLICLVTVSLEGVGCTLPDAEMLEPKIGHHHHPPEPKGFSILMELMFLRVFAEIRTITNFGLLAKVPITVPSCSETRGPGEGSAQSAENFLGNARMNGPIFLGVPTRGLGGPAPGWVGDPPGVSNEAWSGPSFAKLEGDK